MKFDTIIIVACANPSAPAAHAGTCGGTGNNGGGDDDGIDNPNCADPVYAAANPGICLSAPRLIVKPDYAMREAGDAVQYKAFLWRNGNETELTEGVVWRTSNAGVSLIGAASGNAIALAPGIVTISATWGILSAHAQLEVIAVGECANQGHTYVILIDDSQSSSAAFSSLVSSRLAFAKETARNFIDSLDLTKDKVVVMSFNSGSTVVLAESADATVIKAAIDGIAQTSGTTNIQAGLQGAYEVTATGRRVIILFTDGENKTGVDPVTYANSIRGTNALIEVIGLRASGVNFRRLEAIADGGFFINALPSNQADAGTWLEGFKSYLCSGNCAPPGNVTVGVGRLNFNAFTNWNVAGGHVDLIGKNEGGHAVFDLLPGNGLYVDLAGSTTGSGPDLGTLTTKSRFIWASGQTYTVQLRLAGNQREERTPDVVSLTIFDKNDLVIKTVDFTITDFAANFATFSTTFTPTVGQAGGLGGYIQVRQKSIPTGSTNVFGILLDRVALIGPTGLIMLDDNFDNENPTFIDPPCSQANGYAYCYDFGCLDEPIPAQSSDPSPLSDLEGGSVPTAFTATKSYTAACPSNSAITATESRTATSDISQATADSLATAAARAAAEAALDCSRALAVGEMISFVPCLLGKSGYAATGLSFDDIWTGVGDSNKLSNTAGDVTTVKAYPIVSELSAASDLTRCEEIVDASRDLLMLRWYQALYSMSVILKGLPVGTYSLYVYGHGEDNADNATVTVTTGTYSTLGVASGGSTSYGSADTVNGVVTAPWAPTKQYVSLPFAIASDRPDVEISFASNDNPDGVTFFNGFQLKRVS